MPARPRLAMASLTAGQSTSRSTTRQDASPSRNRGGLSSTGSGCPAVAPDPSRFTHSVVAQPADRYQQQGDGRQSMPITEAPASMLAIVADGFGQRGGRGPSAKKTPHHRCARCPAVADRAVPVVSTIALARPSIRHPAPTGSAATDPTAIPRHSPTAPSVSNTAG